MNINSITRNLKDIRSGKKVVLCMGTFDLFHVGHLEFLLKAANLGDILVVGINSDRTVSCRKGSGRPIINQEARELIVAAIKCVYYTFIKEEITKEDLITLLKPEVVIFNSDPFKSDEHKTRKKYLRNKFPDVSFVEFVRPKRTSTTSIIAKIKG